MSLVVIKRLGAGRGNRGSARQVQEERGEVRRVHFHGWLGRQLRATPAKLHGCNQRGTLLSQFCVHVQPGLCRCCLCCGRHHRGTKGCGAQERNVEDEFASDVEVLEVENELAAESENSEDSEDESV